jgi:TonB family protein
LPDSPLIWIVTTLFVWTVSALGCSRSDAGSGPLPAKYPVEQRKVADAGRPADARRPRDLIPGGAASSRDPTNDLVRRIIRRCSPQVRACYEAESANHPGLEGRINVRFTVGGAGQVVSSALGGSTMSNAALETCLVDTVKKCPFPKPLGGGPVNLSYTFDFGPSPKDVRASALSSEELSALECAIQIGGEHNLVSRATPVSVSKGPRFPGEPPDWRSGGEWTVRFVERDLAFDSRDGSFRIVIRTPPCRALQILVPG